MPTKPGILNVGGIYGPSEKRSMKISLSILADFFSQ
jgi:hypothetical protein